MECFEYAVVILEVIMMILIYYLKIFTHRTHCIKEVWFKSSVMGVSRAIERFCAEQYKKNASKVDGVHLLEH